MTAPLKAVARRALTPLRERFSGPIGSVVAVRTAAPEVILTFDDGPEPGGTDAVLDALARHAATATFFVLLTRVRRHPGLLADVLAAGHEVALHGPDHRALTDFSRGDARRRTQAAKAELEDRTGAPVRWFRPPYGRQTLSTWRAVTGAGLVPVLWGATTWDWKDVPQTERITKAMSGAVPGAVLLGHDGFAGPDDGVADGPAPAVDRGDLVHRVLEACAERGLRGRSLGDALSEGTPVKVARFRR